MNPRTKGALCLLLLAATVVALAAVPDFTPTVATPTATTPLAAQDPMQGMDMGQAVNQAIDGAKEPDKIKDVDAWKMFLLAAATASSYDDTRFLFRDTSLTDAQADQIQQIIVSFNQKFSAANDQYNVVADTNGRSGIDNSTNLKSYLKAEKQLTRNAEAQIEDILGNDSSSHFHEVLQFHKKNMKIAIEGDSNQ